MTSDDMQRLTITAPPEAAGERLDRFLATGLEAPSPLSRTRLKALILDGAVTENGAAVIDPSRSVRAEAEYAVLLPPVREATPQAEDIPLDIMFEDDHIIVLNKPSGMVVHPGPGQPDGTLVNALIAHCGDSLTGIGGVMRPGIVHRLDKDTSGVMMAAKSKQTGDGAKREPAHMTVAKDLGTSIVTGAAHSSTASDTSVPLAPSLSQLPLALNTPGPCAPTCLTHASSSVAFMMYSPAAQASARSAYTQSDTQSPSESSDEMGVCASASPAASDVNRGPEPARDLPPADWQLTVK